jgi:hypothetical protein
LRRLQPARRFFAFSAASLLPDADAMAFGLGIPYDGRGKW